MATQRRSATNGKATNARLASIDGRLRRLDKLTTELLNSVEKGFRELRDQLVGLRADLRDLRIDHARVDRLEARMTTLERKRG